jgi:hypothetical protein
MLTMRWSAAGGMNGSGVSLQNAHLHASDCTFSTAAGSQSDRRHAAVKIEGTGHCQLSACTLIGAWPGTVLTPLPSPALDVTAMVAPGVRVWLVDVTFVGGLATTGIGPAIEAPRRAPAIVRQHRGTTFGAVNGVIANGPVPGLQTSIDMHVGGTFTTRMLGEPGHPLLLYAGSDIFGPFGIGEVEQPALGFFHTAILGTLPGNAMGHADFPFVVPNSLALRHVVLWWRGLDLATWPWQATPAFVTVVQ